MKQHEITATRMLLDAFGNVAEPGYAKHPYPVYRRADIKAGKLRIKEWDYYFIGNGHMVMVSKCYKCFSIHRFLVMGSH